MTYNQKHGLSALFKPLLDNPELLKEVHNPTQTMKLTPAEELEQSIPWRGSRIERINAIRQIQADALRVKVAFIRNRAQLHQDREIARECFFIAEQLEREANQLHPLREGKPVTLERAAELAKECTGNDAIEPVNEAHAEWLRTHPQGGVER